MNNELKSIHDLHYIKYNNNDNNIYDYIKTTYDKTFENESLDDIKKYILDLDQNIIPITISNDKSILMSTIGALNVRNNGQNKIIILTDVPLMNLYDCTFPNNNCVLSYLLSLKQINNCQHDYTTNDKQILIKTNQIMLIGLNENMSDNELDSLLNKEIKHFTMDRIEKIGIEKVCISIDNLTDNIINTNIHLIINLKCLSETIVPINDTTNITKTLNHIQLNQLLSCITKYNVIGIDIIIPDVFNVPNKMIITAETIHSILIKLFNIKKSINIYSEHTRFLIYRNMDQDDFYDDIGWYILREIPNDLKETLISAIGTDIKSIQLDDTDTDYLVTTTSIKEQELNSYYTAVSVYDLCLFPQEKQFMMFELIK